MTVVLTDIPPAAAALCGCQPDAAEAVATVRPSASHGAVWSALAPAGDTSCWTLSPAGEAATALSEWSLLVVIDAAPTSQFDALRTLAGRPRGLPADVAAVALTGNGFHGHRGRSWYAERGNLHLSIACRLDLPAADCALALTALPAVAVVDAVATVADGVAGFGIKWVNDILAGGRKLAGVLTATQTERGRLTSAVFGIGLNVARRPEVPPTLFVPEVGCLHDMCAGPPVSLGAVLRAVLAAVARRLAELKRSGPQPLLSAYRAASLVVGEQVCVWAEPFPDGDDVKVLPPPLVSGRVAAIGPDLSLRFAGNSQPIREGRLAFAAVWRQFVG